MPRALGVKPYPERAAADATARADAADVRAASAEARAWEPPPGTQKVPIHAGVGGAAPPMGSTWRRYEDDDGDAYFVCDETGESCWEAADVLQASATPLAAAEAEAARQKIHKIKATPFPFAQVCSFPLLFWLVSLPVVVATFVELEWLAATISFLGVLSLFSINGVSSEQEVHAAIDKVAFSYDKVIDARKTEAARLKEVAFSYEKVIDAHKTEAARQKEEIGALQTVCASGCGVRQPSFCISLSSSCAARAFPHSDYDTYVGLSDGTRVAPRAFALDR